MRRVAAPPEAATMSPSPLIATMRDVHWAAVRAIYQAGIDTGHATFESAPPGSWEAWQQYHINELSLVALEDGAVQGWAALTATSGRCVYAGVAEVSVYVASEAKGRGVGRLLLSNLVARSEARNFWTLTAGIFPENAASIRLHESLGFERVGLRRKLGKMSFGPWAGRWRDVLALERRSSTVGVDSA
jgi:L-amino acid N-acyltransferase YncA